MRYVDVEATVAVRDAKLELDLVFEVVKIGLQGAEANPGRDRRVHRVSIARMGVRFVCCLVELAFGRLDVMGEIDDSPALLLKRLDGRVAVVSRRKSLFANRQFVHGFYTLPKITAVRQR